MSLKAIAILALAIIAAQRYLAGGQIVYGQNAYQGYSAVPIEQLFQQIYQPRQTSISFQPQQTLLDRYLFYAIWVKIFKILRARNDEESDDTATGEIRDVVEEPAPHPTDGWTTLANQCRYGEFGTGTRSEAISACEGFGARLPSAGIRDTTILTELHSTFTFTSSFYFIGLELDGTSSKWLWSDGEEMPINDGRWESGIGQEPHTGDTCGVVVPPGTDIIGLGNAVCEGSSSFDYFCEYCPP